MPDETAIISLQVPEELNAWLEAKAARELTSKSALIRAMILKDLRKEPQVEHSPNTERDS